MHVPRPIIFWKSIGSISEGVNLLGQKQLNPSFRERRFLSFAGYFHKKNSPPGMNGFPLWVFPKIGGPQNGWFIMENPMNKWMIWGENPLFWVDTLIPKWWFGSNLRQVGLFWGIFPPKTAWQKHDFSPIQLLVDGRWSTPPKWAPSSYK